MDNSEHNDIHIERHPFSPFLPEGARILMMGSFPPQQKRWSMDFFYPNYTNDMWRIWGIILKGDRNYFVDISEKRINKSLLQKVLAQKGIALAGTASTVRRLAGNASDKHLEVVEQTDIATLLRALPSCEAIVVTGGKALEIVLSQFPVSAPPMGEYSEFSFEGRTIRLYRMPSTSRAYPMSIEKKSEIYSRLLPLLK